MYKVRKSKRVASVRALASASTLVTRVPILATTPYVGRNCGLFSLLLREVFSWGTPFFLSP